MCNIHEFWMKWSVCRHCGVLIGTDLWTKERWISVFLMCTSADPGQVHNWHVRDQTDKDRPVFVSTSRSWSLFGCCSSASWMSVCCWGNKSVLSSRAVGKAKLLSAAHTSLLHHTLCAHPAPPHSHLTSSWCSRPCSKLFHTAQVLSYQQHFAPDSHSVLFPSHGEERSWHHFRRFPSWGWPVWWSCEWKQLHLPTCLFLSSCCCSEPWGVIRYSLCSECLCWGKHLQCSYTELTANCRNIMI